MSDQNLDRGLLKAIALGDGESIRDLNEKRLASDRDPQQRKDFRTLTSALFVVALEQRFADDTSSEAVKRFVEELRYDYRDAKPPIKPLVTEAVIRAVMGEEHLLDEISAEDQLESQFPVIRKITMQSSDMTARIDSYLDDAQSLAREWESAE